jgi:hypothetical protein
MRRRQFTQFIAFLAGGVAVSAYAGIPVVSASTRNEQAGTYLTRDFFETQLGKVFSVGGDELRTLRLKAVESACCHHQNEQFHAIFEVSPGTPLEEGIYALESNSRPCMDLFLTRSDRGRNHQQLVATINLQTTA